MEEKEIRSRRRVAQLLALATADMQIAAEGARALKAERISSKASGRLMQALETGMVVAYARAFKESKLGRLPRKFLPEDPLQQGLHRELMDWRDKVHAHSEDDLRRGGSVTAGFDPATGIGGSMVSEHVVAFPHERLDDVIALCEQQATRFDAIARALVMEIEHP